MYRALSYFEDLKDGGHPYHAGDPFPRDGYDPPYGRIDELAGTANVRGVPVIQFVAEVAEKPKPTRKRKNAD